MKSKVTRFRGSIAGERDRSVREQSCGAIDVQLYSFGGQQLLGGWRQW